MKAILLSIKPEWLYKILNKEKTIEVRKNKALANAIRELIKQYGKALIYMYCSKDKKFPLVLSSDGESFQEYCNAKYYPPFIRGDVLNGKVVARFWCDEIVEVFTPTYICVDDNYYSCDNIEELLKSACITEDDLYDYIGEDNYHFFAIHISKLEIFDRPRELSEFRVKDKYIEWHYNSDGIGEEVHFEGTKPLLKAPQNYCYVEGE